MFVSRKDLNIPHESIVQGEGRFLRVTEWSGAHKNNSPLFRSCSSVPLFIWHCAVGLPRVWGGFGGEDEERGGGGSQGWLWGG